MWLKFYALDVAYFFVSYFADTAKYFSPNTYQEEKMSDNNGVGCGCGLCTLIVICIFGVILIAIVSTLGSLWYMKENYKTTDPCVALSKAVAEEMPKALNELSIKHPKEVGIIRAISFLVDGVDDKIKELTELVLSDGFKKDKNIKQSLSCYANLIIADIDRDSFRYGIEEQIEKSFNLHSPEDSKQKTSE